MIHVRTLGAAEIVVGDESIRPSSKLIYFLVLYLAAERGHRVARSTLQGLLYPTISQERALHRFRQLLVRTRRLGVPLRSDPDYVSIDKHAVHCDWVSLVESGSLSIESLSAFAGGLLPSVSADFSLPLSEWLDSLRHEIAIALKTLVLERIRYFEHHAMWDALMLAGHALTSLDPLNEAGTIAIITAQAATGSNAIAMELLDRYVAEVGPRDDLRLNALALRRRISERLPHNENYGDPPFTGRETEFERLHALWRRAHECSQQLVLIWGEAGIGKSRLTTEFARVAVIQGSRVTRVHCQRHDVYRPMGGIVDLVSQLLQLRGAIGCAPESREALSRLIRIESDVPATALLRPREPESLFAGTFRAVADLLDAVTEDTPLIITVEDADWLDKTSLTTLSALFSGSHARRCMVMLTSRSRSLLSDGIACGDTVSILRLGPLQEAASRSLLRTLYRESLPQLTAERERELLEQAAGNPYFISTLAQHRSASSSRGKDSVAPTLQEALEQRLDQIVGDERKILEASVVLGKNATPPRLALVVGIDAYALITAVQELEDRGLLTVRDGRVLSRHALLSDLVGASSTPAAWRLLHRNAALVLEGEMKSAASGSLPWDCAEHWRIAGDPTRAIEVLRSCARHTISIGRPADAFNTLVRALSLGGSEVDRLSVVEEALVAAEMAGMWQEVREYIDELHILRTRQGMPKSQHDIFEILEANVTYNCDLDPLPFVELLRRCIASRTASEAHRLSAGRFLLIIAELNCDRNLAEFVHQAAVDIPETSSGRVHLDLIYQTCFGNNETAIQLGREVLYDGRYQGPEFFRHAMNAGLALFRAGDVSCAERVFAESYQTAKVRHLPTLLMQAAIFMTTLQWHAGDMTLAEAWRAKAQDAVAECAGNRPMSRHYLNSLNLALYRGDSAGASGWLAELVQSRQATYLRQPRLLTLAATVLCREVTGIAICSDAEWQELSEGHYLARSFGQHDEVMLAVYRVLACKGEEEHGARLLDEYIGKYRRDGFPPDPRLLPLIRSATD